MTTKADLINRLSSNTGLNKKQAAKIFEIIEGFIYQDLNFDGEALIPGIGKLKVKNRGERLGRNPRTGENLTIAARDVVKFSATRRLKKFVAEASQLLQKSE
jgi:nucleoid DNA-binding protein